MYPAIWQVLIFFSCWPPVAVSPSDGCSTIVWLGVAKVYQKSHVTKKWGSRVPPLFFRRVDKAGLNTCSCFFSTWCSIQSLNPVKSTMWLLNLNICFDLFQFVYTFPKSTGSVWIAKKGTLFRQLKKPTNWLSFTSWGGVHWRASLWHLVVFTMWSIRPVGSLLQLQQLRVWNVVNFYMFIYVLSFFDPLSVIS